MNPREIVNALIGQGFTQTDIARGLDLVAKGSGSYVGGIASGKKTGAQHADPLAAMLRAVTGRAVPGGRKEAEARQQMLRAPEVQPVRRRAAGGRTAAVRKPATQLHQTPAGHQSLKATIGPQAMDSGGRAVADAIHKLAESGGRFSMTITGRFPAGAAPVTQAGKSGKVSNFKPRYKQSRKRLGLRKGSKNVLEGVFNNGGQGFEARDWVGRIAQAGSFMGALEMWASATAQVDMPERLDRIEVYGTPRPEPWNQRR